MARPLGLALVLALATGVVWALLSALLNLHVGLIVLAAFAGWLIGSVVRPIGRHAVLSGVALAALAWLIGSVLDFTLSQLLLPEAATGLAERLTVDGYLAYASATFDIVELAAIALLAIAAWRSAR
jgi:hypothetical protein